MISERTAVNSETKRCQNYVKPQDLQLRMIDLNLFRVFDAMMLHRSVRKASQILSVTPSAVSHALCRLRQSIGDELFNATEFGMQPTQRALELASAVREGLEKLELALTGKESVPLEALRTFRVWATDYPCLVILPSLVKRLAKSAPKVDLRVFPSNHIDIVQQLEKGRADLVIGSFTELPAGIRRSRLLRENEVIAVRTGHPLTRGRMTKERLLEFPHVVIEATGTVKNETNGKIAPGGRSTVCVPNFAAVAPFLQMSDMVAILPRRIALWAAANARLVLFDPPTTSITTEIEMLWDQGADQDQGLQWLVNELAESIGDLG